MALDSLKSYEYVQQMSKESNTTIFNLQASRHVTVKYCCEQYYLDNCILLTKTNKNS